MFIIRSKSCKNNEFVFCVRMTAIMIRSDQIRSDQIRSDQIRSDQIRSDQIRSDQTRFLIRINHIPDHNDLTSQET
jgi:hypothetical protein